MSWLLGVKHHRECLGYDVQDLETPLESGTYRFPESRTRIDARHARTLSWSELFWTVHINVVNVRHGSSAVGPSKSKSHDDKPARYRPWLSWDNDSLARSTTIYLEAKRSMATLPSIGIPPMRAAKPKEVRLHERCHLATLDTVISSFHHYQICAGNIWPGDGQCL